MKTLLLLMMLASSFAFGRSDGGNEGGHGGDPYALEFSGIAKAIGDKLVQEETRSGAAFIKWKFKAADFQKSAKAIRYTSAESDDMVLRGQEVDAINFPDQNLIKVNRARWRELNFRARSQLVLHEVFGILGVERDSFEASLDFKSFLANASKEMETELADSSQMNLFYGLCQSFPALGDASTCGSGTDKLEKAQICATNQAEAKCRMSGKGGCEILNTSYTPKMSTTAFGLRYCEVLVLMK
ncbi:MAG: hypothetical protein JWP85_2757 [Rhodoglobus sp.]|nr:hypothetical protein [Rhodoglobus sp.]